MRIVNGKHFSVELETSFHAADARQHLLATQLLTLKNIFTSYFACSAKRNVNSVGTILFRRVLCTRFYLTNTHDAGRSR